MSEQELGELFDRRGSDCWRLALALTRGDTWMAERLDADAFLEAARSGQVEPVRTRRTWLLCLVRRRAPRRTGR